MSTTPARARARIRAVVVAVLVLAFVIPWTYAHIAYAWRWKEPSDIDTCTGQYYLTPHDKQRSISLGTLADGRVVYMGSRGEVSMGRDIASFGLSVSTDADSTDPLAHAKNLHRGDSTTVEGVGTFTLKRTHSDIVWFTPNPGKATFCFDPDPTFTVYDYAQQGH